MPDKNTIPTFSIVSNPRSLTLADEVREIMLAAGHQENKLWDDPRIIIITGLEESIQLPAGPSDAIEWLKAVINGLQFGGSAVLFCSRYLNTRQLVAFSFKQLPRDHGARKLVQQFRGAFELLYVLNKLPVDLALDFDEEE